MILLFIFISLIFAQNNTIPCLLSSEVVNLEEYLKTDAVTRLKFGAGGKSRPLVNCTFADNEEPFFYPVNEQEVVLYYNKLKEIGAINSSLDDMIEFIRLLKYEPENVGDQMNITCRIILSSFSAMTYIDSYFTDFITKICNNVYRLGPKIAPKIDLSHHIENRRNCSAVGKALSRLITYKTNFNKNSWQNMNKRAIVNLVNSTAAKYTTFAYRTLTYKNVPSFFTYYAQRVADGRLKYELPSFGILKSNPYYNLTKSIITAFIPSKITIEGQRVSETYNAIQQTQQTTIGEWLNTSTLEVMNFFIFLDPAAWNPEICPVDLRAGKNVIDLIIGGCWVARAIHTFNRIRHNRIADLFGLYLPKNYSEFMIPIGEVIDPIKNPSLGFVRYHYLPRGILPRDRGLIFHLSYCQRLSFKYVIDVLFAMIKIPASMYLQPAMCEDRTLQQSLGWLVLNSTACRMQDTFPPYQDTCYFSIIVIIVPIMGFFSIVFVIVFLYYFVQKFYVLFKQLMISFKADYTRSDLQELKDDIDESSLKKNINI